MHQSIDIDIYV